MPIYAYKCSSCGYEHDELRRTDDRDLPSDCPQCSGVSERNRFAELPLSSPDMPYQRPFVSEALGVAPNQVDEARRRFPDHKFTPDGRMVIESHKERKRVLKDLGFVDKN